MKALKASFTSWRKAELQEKLGDDAPLVYAYYGIKDQGNWEHDSNILMRAKVDQEFLSEHSLTADNMESHPGKI